jgi:hypothetical protein
MHVEKRWAAAPVLQVQTLCCGLYACKPLEGSPWQVASSVLASTLQTGHIINP